MDGSAYSNNPARELHKLWEYLVNYPSQDTTLHLALSEYYDIGPDNYTGLFRRMTETVSLADRIQRAVGAATSTEEAVRHCAGWLAASHQFFLNFHLPSPVGHTANHVQGPPLDQLFTCGALIHVHGLQDTEAQRLLKELVEFRRRVEDDVSLDEGLRGQVIEGLADLERAVAAHAQGARPRKDSVATCAAAFYALVKLLQPDDGEAPAYVGELLGLAKTALDYVAGKVGPLLTAATEQGLLTP